MYLHLFIYRLDNDQLNILKYYNILKYIIIL